MGERHHSLRFLTGKSQGSELVLADPGELVVGRSGEAGLLLLDSMVSRKHARFRVDGGVVSVEDLGSANGTFVNGQKIRKAVELSAGDRVLIGATILKLTVAVVTAGTEPTIEVAETVLEPEAARISGELEDGGVAKVLEAYALGGAEDSLPGVGGPSKDTLLELRLDGVPGFVAVYRGRIWDCGLDSLPGAPPMKVLLRMLAATRGEYYVRPGGPPESRRIDVDVSALLVDARRAGDELDVLKQRLPEPSESLALPRPIVPSLLVLDEVDLSLLQLAHNHGRVDRILDASRLTDVEVVRRLLGLLEQGYLRRT